MTDVDVSPSIGQQNPHAVQPTSPKKRTFDEIDRTDGSTGAGLPVNAATESRAASSVVDAVAETPAAAAQNGKTQPQSQFQPQPKPTPASIPVTSQQETPQPVNGAPVPTPASVPLTDMSIQPAFSEPIPSPSVNVDQTATISSSSPSNRPAQQANPMPPPTAPVGCGPNTAMPIPPSNRPTQQATPMPPPTLSASCGPNTAMSTHLSNSPNQHATPMPPPTLPVSCGPNTAMPIPPSNYLAQQATPMPPPTLPDSCGPNTVMPISPSNSPNQHTMSPPVPSMSSGLNYVAAQTPSSYPPNQPAVPMQMSTAMNSGPSPVMFSGPPSNLPNQQATPMTSPAKNCSPTPAVFAPFFASAPTSAPPNKKIKLSAEEKHAKERQKAEEKVKKEEERRQKEEEKRKREEEREEKRRQKEEERQAKEEEKKRKEEEKKKKERSQMRLNAFFAKPITPKEPTSDRGAKSTAKGPETKVGPESKSGQLSDYEKTFPSFYLQSHVKLAPVNRFERDPDALVHICGKIDKCFQGEGDGSFTPGKLNATELFNIIPYKRRHGRLSSPTVREILTSINKPSISHIDLTKDDGAAKRTTRIEDMLKEIPMKTLKFREDVRPPYNGTFTRKLSDGAAVKLSRNPFARVNDVFNYDYDSEAEWEEPEEGEDIDSEGEEDASEDGDDDMEDFLDDTGDQVNRGTVSDLEPICSGIKWDHENGVDPAFEPYKMEMISETLTFPIDPFSDSYWKKPAPVHNSPFKVPLHPSEAASKQHQLQSQPSAIAQPLSASKSDAIRPILNGTPASFQGSKNRNPFPLVLLSEFKGVVSGSDLTKAGLIEVLKKRFPKISKEMIRDTLTSIAVRRGQKEVDKRWILI